MPGYGGQVVFGWLITWYPGVRIEATLHNVWCQPNGHLIDVSWPKFDSLPERGFTTFVELPQYSGENPADRFLVLVGDADVERLTELENLIARGQRELRSMITPIGGGPPWRRQWPAWVLRRREEIQAIRAEAYAEIRELRPVILDRYGEGMDWVPGATGEPMQRIDEDVRRFDASMRILLQSIDILKR